MKIFHQIDLTIFNFSYQATPPLYTILLRPRFICIVCWKKTTYISANEFFPTTNEHFIYCSINIPHIYTIYSPYRTNIRIHKATKQVKVLNRIREKEEDTDKNEFKISHIR